jgi:hypothetical protein
VAQVVENLPSKSQYCQKKKERRERKLQENVVKDLSFGRTGRFKDLMRHISHIL